MTRFARSEWDFRPVVAECPWFQIVEDRTLHFGEDLIRSEVVERAYWKAVFRIIDDREDGSASSIDERIAWAYSLVRLEDYARSVDYDSALLGRIAPPTFANCWKDGGLAVAARMAHTIGRKLVMLRNVPRDRVDVEISACVAAFSNAVRAYAAASCMMRDKRSERWSPLEVEVITTAGLIFLRTKEPPTKKQVRAELEQQGVGCGGTEKKQRELWRKAFERACLGDLPPS